MKQRPPSVACVVYLLFSSACLGMWARSYLCGDTFRYAGALGGIGMTSFLGDVRIPIFPPWGRACDRSRTVAKKGLQCETLIITKGLEEWGGFNPPVDFDFAGFAVLRTFREISASRLLMPWRHPVIVIPYWFLFVGTVMFPLLRTIKRRRAVARLDWRIHRQRDCTPMGDSSSVCPELGRSGHLPASGLAPLHHRLFSGACVISLLLCVATAALWVRSYRIPEGWCLAMTRQYIAQSDSGMLEFDIRRKVVQYLEGIPDNYFPFIPTVLRDGHAEPFSPIPDWSYDGAVPSLFGSSKFWTGFQRHPSNRAGFGLGEEPEVFNVDLYLSGMADCSMSVAITRYVVIPHWFLFALTAILPAIWAARRTAAWRHRRRGPGFCVACGYNLTGNTSGKCPECGTAIPNDRAVIRPSPARL